LPIAKNSAKPSDKAARASVATDTTREGKVGAKAVTIAAPANNLAPRRICSLCSKQKDRIFVGTEERKSNEAVVKFLRGFDAEVANSLRRLGYLEALLRNAPLLTPGKVSQKEVNSGNPLNGDRGSLTNGCGVSSV